MNIYDEAIKDVEEVIHIEGTCSKFIRIRKALIYAKKEHKLLDLYKLLPNLHWVQGVHTWRTIDKLEKELEEMK